MQTSTEVLSKVDAYIEFYPIDMVGKNVVEYINEIYTKKYGKGKFELATIGGVERSSQLCIVSGFWHLQND